MIRKLMIYLFDSTESWDIQDSLYSTLGLGTAIAYLVHAIKTNDKITLPSDSRLLKLLKEWKHWDKVERYVSQ